MRERDRKIFVNACLNKLTGNRNARQICSRIKMGRIDCPAIVQPDLLMTLPNE